MKRNMGLLAENKDEGIRSRVAASISFYRPKSYLGVSSDSDLDNLESGLPLA